MDEKGNNNNSMNDIKDKDPEPVERETDHVVEKATKMELEDHNHTSATVEKNENERKPVEEVFFEVKDDSSTTADVKMEAVLPQEESESVKEDENEPTVTPTDTPTLTSAKEESCEEISATASLKKAMKEPVHIGPVRFAPVNVPSERRWQTLVVCIWICLLPLSICLSIILLFIPVLWAFFIPYLTFIFFDKAPETGGRRIQWLRELKLWEYFRDYFPAVLKKEEGCELDPTKNYVFGYHPHGIISLGALACFGTEATGFSKMFPGITLSLCTLQENFRCPFFRDVLLGLGVVSVSKQSIEAVLNKGPGSSVAIVIGGASEALSARPKTNDVVLEKRKGFIKLALINGANAVPVFCFGETDLYRQAVENAPESKVRQTQESLLKIMGFSFPLFMGRGIFNYSFGIMPLRKRLVIVVGKPVNLPHITNPTSEEIEKYHAEYKDALVRLYDDHKDLYALNRKSSLRIVQ